jgi:threonine dehydrogenase-like Zn-dependent dehydrogenase
MRALCWYGRHDVRMESVPDPRILNPRDAIVRVTSTAICGSDLHLYNGFMPGMQKGDILGHEFMGEVVEVGGGRRTSTGRPGRGAVSHRLRQLLFCERSLWSLCDNSNPNAWMAETLWGHSPAGIFGYSHLCRRLRGRPGRVRAGAVRRRRAD